jgi:hypothetical protein
LNGVDTTQQRKMVLVMSDGSGQEMKAPTTTTYGRRAPNLMCVHSDPGLNQCYIQNRVHSLRDSAIDWEAGQR